MQAQSSDIAEMMENIENIEEDIDALQAFTHQVRLKQDTFDTNMASGIKKLLDSFKQREQELQEEIKKAHEESASLAAYTQIELLNAEIKRLKARIETLKAAKTLSETRVIQQEARIQELEAEVARMKLQITARANTDEHSEHNGSQYDSAGDDDAGSPDAMDQASLQDPDAQTQNSPNPVSINGGLLSAAGSAVASSVNKMLGVLVPGSSSSVTPRPPGTNIVHGPADDQTQDLVPSSAVQVPTDQVPQDQVSKLAASKPEDVSDDPENLAVKVAPGDASAAGPETQPVLSTLNSQQDVLDAIKTYVYQETAPGGVVKYVYVDVENGSKLKKIAINKNNREKIIKYFQKANLSTLVQKTLPGLTDDMFQNFKNDYPLT